MAEVKTVRVEIRVEFNIPWLDGYCYARGVKPASVKKCQRQMLRSLAKAHCKKRRVLAPIDYKLLSPDIRVCSVHDWRSRAPFKIMVTLAERQTRYYIDAANISTKYTAWEWITNRRWANVEELAKSAQQLIKNSL